MIDFDPATIDKDRFYARVQRGQPDECWPWTGRKSRGWGEYGELSHQGRTLRAHRVALAIDRGAGIPQGMFVLHLCDNPPCCNPRHLQVGTHVENMAQMRERKRHIPHAPCGTRSAYVRGCRCQLCRDADTIYKRAWSRKARNRSGKIRGARRQIIVPKK